MIPMPTTTPPVVAATKPAPIPPKPTPATTKPVATKPEPPPSVPATRVAPTGDKYADMAREYERTANGTWTVQFELVCQSASVGKAVEEGGSEGVVCAHPCIAGSRAIACSGDTYDEAAALAVSSIPAPCVVPHLQSFEVP